MVSLVHAEQGLKDQVIKAFPKKKKKKKTEMSQLCGKIGTEIIWKVRDEKKQLIEVRKNNLFAARSDTVFVLASSEP